jgi:ribosomal protein RSM22 (predicted rRNA methylase)
MTAHSIAGVDKKLASVLEAARTVLAERLRARGLSQAAAAGHLAAAVRRVSLAYRREQGSLSELMRDREAIDARLAFFLPRDLPKLVLPLRELAAAGALPRAAELRVLDLGAGLGTSGLGAAAFLLGSEHAERVHIYAVDVDTEALAIAQRLARELSSAHGFALEIDTAIRPLELVAGERAAGQYDLIVLGLVLNEIEGHDGAAALTALCQRLAPGGALIVLEPALRETSRALQHTRDALVAAARAPYVFAPCLHARPCPLLERERDWCHERIQLALPEDAATLARAAGLRDEDLTFSYLTLRNTPGSLAELRAGSAALYRVVGGPLITKGKRELLVCGSDQVRVLRRLDRKASQANQAFEQARRGSVLAVEAGDVAGPDRAIVAETPIQFLHEG